MHFAHLLKLIWTTGKGAYPKIALKVCGLDIEGARARLELHFELYVKTAALVWE